jgi:aryl-alcohol dehydrogenase-like predicted oxidoreductase
MAATMRYRLLGNSGLRVSELCLGTMTFGDDWGWGAGSEAARAIYDAFREAGGNFIDTANLYTNGTSERLLGEFMQGHRESVVLATKFGNAAPGTDPNAAGNHRKNMVQAVEASLQRLQTDYIDLYWLHIWDQMTPIDEVMRGFDDLVRSGKILYAGISDAPAWWIARGNTIAELRGWTRFIALQVEYSLLERTPERELLPMAQALGLGVTAWSPLAGGLLSGKYHGGEAKEGRYQNEMMKGFRPDPERVDRIVAALQRISRDSNVPPAQIALAWLLHRPSPVIPIIGTRKISQLTDNLAALEVKLTAEQLEVLEEASSVSLGFPHEFYQLDLVRTFAYGGLRDRILPTR